MNLTLARTSAGNVSNKKKKKKLTGKFNGLVEAVLTTI
jgi:hypothetical protein